MKRIWNFLVCLVLVCGVALPGAALAAGGFADVPADAWYRADVETAQELGLFTGKTDTTFAPEAPLTRAEAVTLAARMRQRFVGDTMPSAEAGKPWYDGYERYALAHGILESPLGVTANAPAARLEFVALLSAALPEEAREAVNTIPDNAIPDVKMGDSDAQAVYACYRAGILQGSDAAGTFRPAAQIRRSEVAAILVRAAQPERRLRFTLPGTVFADLDAVRAYAAQQGAACSVAWLGFGELDAVLAQAAHTYAETLPFLGAIADDRKLVCPGEEVYCLIPTQEDATLVVYAFVLDESNDFQGGRGQELYRAEAGEPLVVQGNVSDLFPNFVVCLEQDGKEIFSYSPRISLRDGSVVTQPDVRDLTRYSWVLEE